MLKSRSVTMLAGLAALGSGAMLASPAGADVVPPDFQIGVCGTPCTLGIDPNPINPNNFSISVQGSKTVDNPLLILIAEPNPGATAPTLSVPSGVTADAANKYFGLTVSTTGNLTGALELSNFNGSTPSGPGISPATTGIAYDAMNLVGTPNSQSFTSYTTNPFPGGATNPNAGVSSFSLYAIAITETGGFSNVLSGFDLSNVELNSYVFAYGCQTLPSPITNNCSTGMDNIGATPFTNTGDVVPAPVIGHGLFVLLAVGGVLFGGKLLESLKTRHSHA
jgi:hypothetical protein